VAIFEVSSFHLFSSMVLNHQSLTDRITICRIGIRKSELIDVFLDYPWSMKFETFLKIYQF